MDLWIRSQDKMTLKKINDLSISQNLLTKVYTIFCDNYVFGDYTTKERALEVLDEIQNILQPQKIIKTIDNTVKIENAIHIVNPTYETITQFDTYVYEMPTE